MVCNHARNCEMAIDEIKKHKFCPEEYVIIKFEDFEQGLGISRDTAKKYIFILEQKDRIVRKKGLGGYLYKILGK